MHRRPFVRVQRSAPALKTIPACATYSCARQLDNLSVDDSRASQSLSLLLSIILGSAVKTTSVQVTAKTMKTILCAHRVQCRPCPSLKAIIRATLIELLRRRTQCRRQEHNQRRPGRRSKSFPCRLPFTNAKKMAAYINVSPAILRLYLQYKFQCNNTTVASRIIYIYIILSYRNMKPYNKIAK